MTEAQMITLSFNHALRLYRNGEIWGRGENRPRIAQINRLLYDLPPETVIPLVVGNDIYCKVCNRNPESPFYISDNEPYLIDITAFDDVREFRFSLERLLGASLDKPTPIEYIIGGHRNFHPKARFALAKARP